MRTHQEIDDRSLALARAIVARIDADPLRSGLTRARRTCARWTQDPAIRSEYIDRWCAILDRDWPAIRAVLLDTSADGVALRQCSPFAGVLPPTERWRIYREHGARALDPESSPP